MIRSSIFAMQLKKSNMITLKDYGGSKSKESLMLQYCIKGKIIRYLVPKFDGTEVRVKDCYTDKVWAEHGNDQQNYEWQMKTACQMIFKLAEKDPKVREQFTEEDLVRLQKGKTPIGYTVHHAYSIGKDLIAVLVKTEDHKRVKHKGASYFANESNLIKDTESQNISNAKKIFNEIQQSVLKNPKASSIIVGTGAMAMTYYFTGKVTKNKPLKIAFSSVIGIAVGLLTNRLLTKEDIIYC